MYSTLMFCLYVHYFLYSMPRQYGWFPEFVDWLPNFMCVLINYLHKFIFWIDRNVDNLNLASGMFDSTQFVKNSILNSNTEKFLLKN